MSLLDIVADKYETPARGALSALSATSPIRAAKAAKAPRPTRLESGKAVVIDWNESPLVKSVDEWSKRLRESPDELRRAAGDDWGWVSANDATLIGFADSLAIVQIRGQGRIPDNYTATAICRNCGPVPFYESSFLNLEACVWCMNGLTAPPVPSPGADDER